jgi:hypothetical protein
MARPGLEPGTPRFSDSCTRLSNARESPATTRFRAPRTMNREVRKLHEIAGNDGHEVPLVSESPGCGQMLGRPEGGAWPTRELRRFHCSRSSRVGCAPPHRPGQERRSWRPTRSLAPEGGRGVMSRLSPPHRAFHRAGVAGHAAPAPPGKAPVCRESARKGFPSDAASAWRGGQPALGGPDR